MSLDTIPDVANIPRGALTLIIALGLTQVVKFALRRQMHRGWLQSLLAFFPVAVGLRLGMVPGWLSEDRAVGTILGLGAGALAVVAFSATKRTARSLLGRVLALLGKGTGT